MTLDGATAIVTGASSGIGRGIADALAEAGASVVVADVRRDPKSSEHFDLDDDEPTDQYLQAEYGVDARFVETDVGDPGAVAAVVEATVETFGGVDVVVNNAGIILSGDSRSLTLAEWNRTIAVNLTSSFLLAKHAGPHLRESDRGRIVNVASVNACVGGSGPAYAATKAALVNLTRDQAYEFAADDVTANCVLPGSVKAPSQDSSDEAGIEAQRERTLLSRLGTPRDVGNAVRFLASEDAEWITGTPLLVDGGYLASQL